MIKLKNFISFFISLIVIFVITINMENIVDKLKKITDLRPEVIVQPANQFKKNDNFIFVKQVDDYVPYDYNDLVNIFYSVLNQGWDEFTFYCPIEYENCLEDVAKISYDEVLLSDINNYVHPYNSYSTIKTLYDDTGEITIKITHLYSDNEINKIDADIESIINNNVKNNMSDSEKIRIIHDYIINNTQYDTKRANNLESPYDSSRILGLLYDKYSICSGYTDTMSVVLNKLNIPNFKIASETHIWNAVFIDGSWKHLDLTWDDPVTASGKQVLDHSYFLIDDDELRKLDINIKEHIFDKNVYLEFNA